MINSFDPDGPEVLLANKIMEMVDPLEETNDPNLVVVIMVKNVESDEIFLRATCNPNAVALIATQVVVNRLVGFIQEGQG